MHLQLMIFPKLEKMYTKAANLYNYVAIRYDIPSPEILLFPLEWLLVVVCDILLEKTMNMTLLFNFFIL